MKCPKCGGKLIEQDFFVIRGGESLDIYCCSKCKSIIEENELDEFLINKYKSELKSIVSDLKKFGYSTFNTKIFDLYKISLNDFKDSLKDIANKDYSLIQCGLNTIIIKEKKEAGNLIYSYFPKAKHFVDVIGSPISTLLGKETYQIETYNDTMGLFHNFFNVIRDVQKEKLLLKRVKEVLANNEYINSCDTFWGLERDSIEAALSFYCSAIKENSYEITTLNNVFLEEHDEVILWISERLKRIQVDDRSIEKTIKAYNLDSIFLYIDLRYLPAYNSHSQIQVSIEDIFDFLKNTESKFLIISSANDFENFKEPSYTVIETEYGYICINYNEGDELLGKQL